MSGSIFDKSLFRGKTALITGGGSGINLGIARRWAEHGGHVALIGRTQEKLDRAAQEIRQLGAEATGFAADVRDYDALSEAITRAGEQYGRFHMVVCGAAGNFPASATGMCSKGFRTVIDIDLVGTFNTCHASYPHLHKPGASVLAISAPQSQLAMPFQSHVCAAKSGIDRLMQSLALEWGGEGIRVNAISPGGIDDTEGMRRLAPSESAYEAGRRNIPLGRYGRAEEIADMALFLSSPAAAWITGQIYAVDGGSSLVGGLQMARAFSGG